MKRCCHPPTRRPPRPLAGVALYTTGKIVRIIRATSAQPRRTRALLLDAEVDGRRCGRRCERRPAERMRPRARARVQHRRLAMLPCHAPRCAGGLRHQLTRGVRVAHHPDAHAEHEVQRSRIPPRARAASPYPRLPPPLTAKPWARAWRGDCRRRQGAALSERSAVGEPRRVPEAERYSTRGTAPRPSLPLRPRSGA